MGQAHFSNSGPLTTTIENPTTTRPPKLTTHDRRGRGRQPRVDTGELNASRVDVDWVERRTEPRAEGELTGREWEGGMQQNIAGFGFRVSISQLKIARRSNLHNFENSHPSWGFLYGSGGSIPSSRGTLFTPPRWPQLAFGSRGSGLGELHLLCCSCLSPQRSSSPKGSSHLSTCGR